MIKILLVEDTYSKTEAITRVLEENTINFTQIQVVQDLRSAKQALKSQYFDLMILDISIPTRIGEKVKSDGGLELLKELDNRSIYKIPQNIIGITANDSIKDQATRQFSDRVLSLIYFQENSDQWSIQLSEAIKRILASLDSQDQSIVFSSFLLIVCALEHPELEALKNNGWSWVPVNFINDDSLYFKTTLKIDEEAKEIYAVAAAKPGMTATAVTTTKAISILHPKYVAMIGITAAVEGKAYFGDILVADPAWDWGSGKWVNDNGSSKFQHEPYQISLTTNIRNKISAIKQDYDELAKIKRHWQGPKPINELKIVVGPMASGSSVLADGKTIEQIKDQQRKLIGIEMESYALYVSAYEALAPKPSYFSLKSVVDFADSKKSDDFHDYAAYTSAAALKLFTEKYL